MFDFLFGPLNPTRDWPPPTGESPRLDLDSASLNGVPLSARLSDLRLLGPDASGKRLRENSLSYPEQGVFIDFDDDRVTGYSIVNKEPTHPEATPFSGVVSLGDQEFDITAIGLDGFLTLAGEPYFREDDDEETLLFYEFPRCEWQVEFSRAGEFEILVLTSDPLMSDPEQRASYGVTKPWPPNTYA